MKKKMPKALRGIMLLGICWMLIHIPTFATQSQLDDVKEEIEQLEEEQEQAEQELEGLQEEKAYLDGEVAKVNEQLSILAGELTELQTQQQETEDAIRLTNQELETAKMNEEQQYEDMKKRIRFMYERGETSMLESLLGAQSFTDFLNLSAYAESLYEHDRKMLAEYQAIKIEIQEKELALEQKKEELAKLVTEQESKMAQVETALGELENSAVAMNEQISASAEQLAEYEAQIEQQKAYEEELERKKAEEDAKRLEEIKRQEEENENNPPIISDSREDLLMLAALIECEAGGESYYGQLAVGSVVMNRVRSSYFPNSIVEVIYQRGQFSPVASGRFATVLSRGANDSCMQAAQETLAGKIVIDALYFRRNNGTIQGTVIGNHIFY